MSDDKIKKAEERLVRAKNALSAMKRTATKQERKDRDTAIFTAGAVLLAAIETNDSEAIELWKRIAKEHAPLITDYRRKCVEKTPLGIIKAT